jgi:hypothetical protein
MSRTLGAAVTGLLAAVLLPLSIASVWVDRVVTDTDRYVDTVAPLAEHDEVKAAAVKALQREALRLVASRLPVVPPGTDSAVHAVVVRVVDSEAFRAAWREANRTAHLQLVAALEGRGSARSTRAAGSPSSSGPCSRPSPPRWRSRGWSARTGCPTCRSRSR